MIQPSKLVLLLLSCTIPTPWTTLSWHTKHTFEVIPVLWLAAAFPFVPGSSHGSASEVDRDRVTSSANHMTHYSFLVGAERTYGSTWNAILPPPWLTRGCSSELQLVQPCVTVASALGPCPHCRFGSSRTCLLSYISREYVGIYGIVSEHRTHGCSCSARYRAAHRFHCTYLSRIHF